MKVTKKRNSMRKCLSLPELAREGVSPGYLASAVHLLSLDRDIVGIQFTRKVYSSPGMCTLT